MRKGFFLFMIFLISLGASAQNPEQPKAVPLCSSIREIIFSAHEKQFKNLMDAEMKGSYGYQVRGSWRFETTQYETILPWPGATKSYIDNSEERTDSSFQLTRQYVAEFKNLPNTEEARRKFELLNQQITECRILLADTNITVLKPLPLEKIKDDLPVAALDAKLYPLTIKEADAASAGQEVVIMTAYEKSGRYYNAYMIVEYRLRIND